MGLLQILMASRLLTAMLLLSMSPTILGRGCPPQFPDECFCGKTFYNGLIQYVVNCTDTRLHNTSVLVSIPEDTEVLIFTGNFIPELPWNVFGALNNYSLLTVIDMSNNHIREIRGKSYHHVQNVKRLILNHNNLSISRNDDEVNHHHPRVFSNFINLEALHLTDAFSDNTSAELSEDLHDIFVNSELSKLRKLHLEQNEITKFKDHRVFCDLPKLQDLHLGDNKLKEINFDVYCLNNLRFLDLQRNEFESLSNKDLVLLDALQAKPNRSATDGLTVDFGLNPFVCDCRLDSFQKWLKETNITIRNKGDLSCYRDKIYPDRVISTRLDECSIVQEPLTAHSDAHTFTMVFLLVILCFILFGLVSTLVYMSRQRIKYFFSPVLDTVSKKVQYTTIKDEECPEVHV